MANRKTSVLIDSDLLERVRAILGTETLRETIERAFMDVLRHEARKEEIQALSRMDGLELDDPEVMAGAWRS